MKMRFDVMTIFPTMIENAFKEGVVVQAISAGKIQLKTWNLRDVARDNHKTIDDRPFGGGDGMVMLPEILKQTVENIFSGDALSAERRRVIYLSPQGPKLTQHKVENLAREYDQIVL